MFEIIQNVLVFILGTLVGFVLPGFGLSRRWSSPIPACTTVLISILNLFLVVLVYQLIGIPLRFFNLFPTLAFISLLCLYLGRNGSVSGLTIADWKAHRGAALLIGLLVLEMLIRTAMCPLSGADTGFRWGFLGTQIYDHGHFNYYPPLTAADFEQYSMVDAIPPLISICYYWIYECCSGIVPRMTSVFVTVQYLLSISLVFSCGKDMKNSAAGLWGAAIFAGTELGFWATGMGQETGILGLSALATLAVLVRVRRRNKLPYILLAASVTAVGMLAREYGGVILLCGAATILLRRLGKRAFFVYITTSFLLCGGWYIRSWVLTGNPFYSIKTVAFFSVHLRYDEMITAYKSKGQLSSTVLWSSVKSIGILSFLPFFIGPIFLVAQAKKRPFFIISVLLLVLVWLVSVPLTASLKYSLRVLHLAEMILCVGAGILAERWGRNSLGRALVNLTVISCLLWNLINMSTFPASLRLTQKSLIFTRLTLSDYEEVLQPISDANIEVIEENLADGSRIVVFSSYHWVSAYRRKLPVASFFSPAADGLFSDEADIDRSLQELKEQKIGMIMFHKDWKMGQYGKLFTHIVKTRKNLAAKTDDVEIYRVD